MRLLALETTGNLASVALADERGGIWEREGTARMSHLQNLIPMADQLLKERALQLSDITHIAVSQGPGSFTGIRIGIATCKALAQTMDLPVISVPTLMSFAWNSRSEGRLICPIFDARREQVYAGAYCWEGDGDMPFQAVEDGAYEIEAFLDRAAKACEGLGLSRILVFGEGIFAYEKRAEDWKSNMQRLSSKDDLTIEYAAPSIRNQRASSVAALALVKARAGQTTSFDRLEPVYIRKAEAQRKLEERLALAAEAKAAAEGDADNRGAGTEAEAGSANWDAAAANAGGADR